MPLLDRLVAAEPTWRNYDQRARVHIGLRQGYEAIRDELEAARLLGDWYWFERYSPDGWTFGASIIVQTPGRPREEYELALRWVEANKRAGVSDDPTRPLIPSLAQFRLGRYADALATLRQSDVPKLSRAAGMLMSSWNLLTIIGYNESKPRIPRKWQRTTQLDLDPMDLAVRAMCHHHLGQPNEAAVYLRQTRDLLGKEGGTVEQRALLREAETLIEGKARP